MPTTAAALAVNSPAVELSMVTVQVAVLPETVGEAQVLLIEPGAGVTDGVMLVKVAFGEPAGGAVTGKVRVWEARTSVTGVGAVAMGGWAVAVAVKTAAVSLLMVTVQVATLPLMVGALQVLDVESGAGLTAGTIEVNSVVCPGSDVTVTVKVCGWPTSLTASGAIAMLG